MKTDVTASIDPMAKESCLREHPGVHSHWDTCGICGWLTWKGNDPDSQEGLTVEEGTMCENCMSVYKRTPEVMTFIRRITGYDGPRPDLKRWRDKRFMEWQERRRIEREKREGRARK